ncbi:MAG: sensor histidine kinase [Brevibacterium yomogidense]
MTHETPAPQSDPDARTRRPGSFGFSLRQLGRDYAYVLPGFFLSLAGFIVLVPLFALSIATFVVWVGALLLPLTLTIARGFAQLSRTRVRHWGTAPVLAHYRPASPGLAGWVTSVADPRPWLDLVFETVIALPLRLLTFVVAVSWSAAAVSGVTYVLWGAFLPDDGSGALTIVLDALFNGALPSSVTDSFALEALAHFVLGVLFLLSLPAVIHALARLDAAITVGALGSNDGGPSPALGTAVTRPGHAATHSGLVSSQHSPASSNPSPEAWAWLSAGFAAIVMLAVSWPVTVVVYGVPVVLAMVITLLQSAALVLAVRWPIAGIAGGAAAVFAMAWATGTVLGLPWPWPVTTLITIGLLVLVLALRHPWPYAVAGWISGAVASVLAVLLLRSDGFPGAIDSVLIAAPICAGLVALGISIRQLTRSRESLRRAEEASAQQSAQRRELAERNRIAQELHDVVAHSMSVISVQATTAEYRLPHIDDDSAQEFASIADSSRRALNEMRGLLTILRGSGDAPLVPQPTLLDIPDLLDATRQSGTTITVDSSPEDVLGAAASRISTSTGLTSYRILQEALSNAVRHAPGADIAVVLGLSDSHLILEVENGPATTAASASDSPDLTPSTSPDPTPSASPDPTSPPGGGLGLAGIRERATALGGTVEAGPRPDGGFAVHARLPTL